MQQSSESRFIRAYIQNWRSEQKSIALVPTMGNLHAGHLSLVSLAKQNASKVVVTLFVNELQFNSADDFASYPRTLEYDLKLLANAGVDLVYAPQSEDLYPNGLNNHTLIRVPILSEGLCGRHRPGHFEGVCTIMAKLVNITQPDIVVMGEKDYQQVMVLKKMFADLNFNARILTNETVRESDQLAMSSRNQHLSANERKIAPVLYATLQWISEQYPIYSNTDRNKLLSEARNKLEEAGFEVDYLEVRDAETLFEPTDSATKIIVLTAAYLGKTRLIDNLIFTNPK